MDELKNIIKELKEIIKNENLEVSGECIFENACDIFISDRINKYNNWKDKIKENKQFKEKEPITKNQLNYLKSQNYRNPEKLTKEEAKNIIGNYVDNLNKKNI